MSDVRTKKSMLRHTFIRIFSFREFHFDSRACDLFRHLFIFLCFSRLYHIFFSFPLTAYPLAISFTYSRAFCFSDCYACHRDTHYFLLFFSAAAVAAAPASGTEIKFEPNWKQKQRCQRKNALADQLPNNRKTKNYIVPRHSNGSTRSSSIWTQFMSYSHRAFSPFANSQCSQCSHSSLFLVSRMCFASLASLSLPLHTTRLTNCYYYYYYCRCCVAAAASTVAFSFVLSFSHTFRFVSFSFYRMRRVWVRPVHLSSAAQRITQVSLFDRSRCIRANAVYNIVQYVRSRLRYIYFRWHRRRRISDIGLLIILFGVVCAFFTVFDFTWSEFVFAKQINI